MYRVYSMEHHAHRRRRTSQKLLSVPMYRVYSMEQTVKGNADAIANIFQSPCIGSIQWNYSPSCWYCWLWNIFQSPCIGSIQWNEAVEVLEREAIRPFSPHVSGLFNGTAFSRSNLSSCPSTFSPHVSGLFNGTFLSSSCL